jgi:hypothetical protein
MFLCFLSLVGYLIITGTIQATRVSVNVYLKLKPDNQVASLIKDFNQFLQQKGLLHTYHITPFIHHYPLHITLYLSTYEKKQLTKIIKKTQWLAKQQKQIPISTHQFLASPNGYVMLSVKPSRLLQELSSQTLNSLAGLRDPTAPIPDWAAEDKKRSELFTQWGNTSVMSFFQPHFSLFDPEYLSSEQHRTLYKRLQQLIAQFSKTHPIEVKDIAYAIGIGIADKQGQVVQELRVFELP